MKLSDFKKLQKTETIETDERGQYIIYTGLYKQRDGSVKSEPDPEPDPNWG